MNDSIIIIGVGGPVAKDISDLMEDLNKEVCEMFTDYRYYEPEKNYYREEKLKQSQTYKRKNQSHPAFRK